MNTEDLTKDFEKIIVAWLKTNDENATNLAYLLAKDAETKQLSMRVVVDSERFTEADLLNGYQAGCVEGLGDCCDLGLNDLKEIKEDGKKWVKRYTE